MKTATEKPAKPDDTNRASYQRVQNQLIHRCPFHSVVFILRGVARQSESNGW